MILPPIQLPGAKPQKPQERVKSFGRSTSEVRKSTAIIGLSFRSSARTPECEFSAVFELSPWYMSILNLLLCRSQFD
jgi:hypothetical protein